MANQDLHNTEYRDTYVERERIPASSSTTGAGIAAVVGGIVVAVLVLFWLFSAGSDDVPTQNPGASVTIEQNDTAPAIDTAPAADAPAATVPTDEETVAPAAPTEDSTAPAELESAPATGGTTEEQPSGN